MLLSKMHDAPGGSSSSAAPQLRYHSAARQMRKRQLRFHANNCMRPPLCEAHTTAVPRWLPNCATRRRTVQGSRWVLPCRAIRCTAPPVRVCVAPYKILPASYLVNEVMCCLPAGELTPGAQGALHVRHLLYRGGGGREPRWERSHPSVKGNRGGSVGIERCELRRIYPLLALNSKRLTSTADCRPCSAVKVCLLKTML